MISDPSIITSQTFSGCSKSVGHSPKFKLFATLGGLSQTFELFSKRLGPYRAASSLNVQDQTVKRLRNWDVWAQTAERLKVFQNVDPTLNVYHFLKRRGPDRQAFENLFNIWVQKA